MLEVIGEPGQNTVEQYRAHHLIKIFGTSQVCLNVEAGIERLSTSLCP